MSHVKAGPTEPSTSTSTSERRTRRDPKGSALTALTWVLALGWMEPLYRVGFADWMTPRFGPYLPSLAFALSFVGVWWLVVWAMDRRGWYLKV